MSERDELRKLVDTTMGFIESRYQSGFCSNDVEELRQLLESLLSAPEAAPRQSWPVCKWCHIDLERWVRDAGKCPGCGAIDFMETAPPAAEPRHDYDSPPHSLTSGLPCPVCAAEPPAGEDWALAAAKAWYEPCLAEKWPSDLNELAQHIRTAAEREMAEALKRHDQSCYCPCCHEPAVHSEWVAEREQKARLDAIEECCKTICVYCAEGMKSASYQRVWKHIDANGAIGHCYAHAIRALSTSAGEVEK